MRLLLVEDDKVLLTSLKKSLEVAGYAVDNADNGIDGEYLGNEGIYDLIILDLGLPKRNGLEVLSNWRNNNNVTPVIILTARDAWHERVDGFKAGADDYLGKPFHIEELLARLSALLNRTQKIPIDKIQQADLILDEDRQTVTTTNTLTHEQTIHSLTATEYRLLRYMILNPDKLLTKTRLTEHIYDFDSDKDSNVIEVYIRRLRQHLGKKRIETRRNQGYIFKSQAIEI